MKNKIKYFIFIIFLIIICVSVFLFLQRLLIVRPDNIKTHLNNFVPLENNVPEKNNIVIKEKTGYKIFYKTKPMIMFLNEYSEKLSFETYVPTKARIEYGETKQYGKTFVSDGFKEIHEEILLELKSDTRYFYTIKIFDENNNVNEDIESMFITKPKNRNDFYFSVLGDSRPVSGSLQPEVFSALIRQMALKEVRFVVMLGDMVQLSDVGRVSKNEAEERWKQFTETIFPLSSQIPWYAVVGNHDETDQENSLEVYRKIWTLPYNGGNEEDWFNETLYWFDFGNSLFLVLNTEEPGYENSISVQEYFWIQKILEEKGPRYRHIFIFSHKPIMGSNRKIVMPKEMDLHELFLKNKVTAVFSGHDHLYCKIEKEGIRYFISGGAGSPLYSNLCEGFEISKYHFLLVNVDNNKITVSAINESGDFLDITDFFD